MRERRRENRFWCADLVKVEWSTEQGQTGVAEGVLEDISELGACVQLEEPIPAGAAISILPHCAEPTCRPDCLGRTQAVRFAGLVSHCEFGDCGYFVGIRLSTETRWSSGVFAPRHLTDPAALAEN